MKMDKKCLKNNRIEVPSQLQINTLLEHYQNRRFIDAEKLAISILQQFPENQFAWKVLGAILKLTGRISEALAVGRKSLQISPLDEEAHNNLGTILQELERYDEAEESYKKAIALKPDFAGAHNNLGTILQELARYHEAETSFIKAISLTPDYAEAYCNLGNTLHKLRKFEEAEVNLKKAIALEPQFSEAHSNLGNILAEQRRLDEATESYKKAIAFQPNIAEFHYNLGNTLNELKRFEEACYAYIQALELNSNLYNAYANFSLAFKQISFNSSNPKLYPPLIKLLTSKNLVSPWHIAKSILNLLKHDPKIKDLLLDKNFDVDIKQVESIIKSLDKFTILHHLMRVSPLPDLQYEKFFTKLRRFLLMHLDQFEETPVLINFLSTLSLHCFTNEYIYFQKKEETNLIKKLEAEISESIIKSEYPEIKKILCLASYRPLHQYIWCQKLTVIDHLEDVKSRLIREPYEEKIISENIPLLKEISDEISCRVKVQYEKNPYPRWVKNGIPTKAKSISEICNDLKLDLKSENIKKVTNPSILIAGCGTGQHSIATASRFSNCQVTAFDLSIASLSYAKRKTIELGITNLEYLQADILNLNQLENKFDIIESVGVLHHMNNPTEGWKILSNLLKPGGLIKIGLYSKLARKHIVEIRKEIKLLKLGTTEDEIREFRKFLVKSYNKNYLLINNSIDFFSLSMFRDLVFHVQEHLYTLPMIQNCLNELGLKFCGFENKNIVSNFIQFYGNDTNIYDLSLWHKFEKQNPNAFYGMYNFWCQKL